MFIRLKNSHFRRIRDKYEAEVEELERSERQTMERYNQTKVSESLFNSDGSDYCVPSGNTQAALAEYEGENERLKVTMKQKDREVMEVKRVSVHLTLLLIDACVPFAVVG